MSNIKIIDNSFKHVSSVGSTDVNRTPTNFTWDRTPGKSNFVIVTDDFISSHRDSEKIKVAWLVEPEAVRPDIYRYIRENHHKYHYIFTHNKNLLSIDSDKFKFIPTAGCWISDGDCKIHDKTKAISIIASGKKDTEGHKMRHQVVSNLSRLNIKEFGVYGREYNPIENKIEALKDYMFSVVIENSREDLYFTEKIIDCFATGTIPIYWGAKDIGKFFNPEGIIKVSNVQDIRDIHDCHYLSHMYAERKDAIAENFEIAKRFYVPEDHIEKELEDLRLWYKQ